MILFAAIDTAYDRLTVHAASSVTSTVNEKPPGVVGVPASNPAGVSVSPGGSAPAEIENT